MPAPRVHPARRISAMSIVIRTVDPDEFPRLIDSLAVLLKEAVDNGAALGFVPPFAIEEAERYWHSIKADINAGSIRLVIAERDRKIVGCGQLVLPHFPAMRHRTELQKLCVLAAERGTGIGHGLMDALHAEATRNGRRLVVLTTRKGGYPQTFYRNLGYEIAGVIPGYTIDRQGNRYDTAVLCREL